MASLLTHPSPPLLPSKGSALVVDDESTFCELLTEYLKDEGFTTFTAHNGEEAWKILQQHPSMDVILTDRLMPVMGGIELLQKLKADPILHTIPVIMHTSAPTRETQITSIQQGVYYFLSKPFDKKLFTAITHAAVERGKNVRRLIRNIDHEHHFKPLTRFISFQYRTLEETETLASFLASLTPDPERTLPGVLELLLNAIEHGNLDIGYDKKRELLLQNQWEAEIVRRLNLAPFKHRYAHVEFHRNDTMIEIIIRDSGKGFDWKLYQNPQSFSITAPNGRGIAMASLDSFEHLEYRGSGNEVLCRMGVE